MNYFLALLKKDFLLSKWCMLTIVLANLIVVPLFFWYVEPEIGGASMLFTYSTFFSAYLTLATLSTSNTKFSKAEAGLCSTPYPRPLVVLARYGYLLALFLLCLVIHVLWRLVLPGATMFTVLDIFPALLLYAVMVSLYLPLRYRFHPQVAAIVLFAFYFATLFFLSSLFDSSTLSEISAVLNTLVGLPLTALSGILLAVIFVMVVLSSFLSIWIYQRKNL